jgi:hypothetical protein
MPSGGLIHVPQIGRAVPASDAGVLPLPGAEEISSHSAVDTVGAYQEVAALGELGAIESSEAGCDSSWAENLRWGVSNLPDL